MASQAVTIGALAERSGFSAKTIRYYESIGLLPPPPRSSSGYRQYGVADESRLGFIAKAKQLGLRLDEIREILSLYDAGSPPCGHVLRLLDEHVQRVDRALEQLGAFRTHLRRLRSRARRNAVPAGTGVCRIIDHTERGSPEVGALAQHALHGGKRLTR